MQTYPTVEEIDHARRANLDRPALLATLTHARDHGGLEHAAAIGLIKSLPILRSTRDIRRPITAAERIELTDRILLVLDEVTQF
jgi:hypothetical protein